MEGWSGRRAAMLAGVLLTGLLLARPSLAGQAARALPDQHAERRGESLDSKASAGCLNAPDDRGDEAKDPQIPQSAAPASAGMGVASKALVPVEVEAQAGESLDSKASAGHLGAQDDRAEKSEQGEAAPANPSEVSFVVLELATNEPELQTEALSVAALIGQRIAQRPDAHVIGPENAWGTLREKAERLRDCLRPECVVEVGQALETRYVVQGRLDKFGKEFLLTASIADARTGEGIARVREPAPEEIDFPWAADRVGDQLADAVGLKESRIFDVTLEGSDDPVAHLNLKLGNTIAALKGFNIDTFTLRFDLEVDYYLRRYLLVYLEAGLAVGRASEEGEPKGTFSLVPVTFGLKYVLFHQREIRPYTGLGLGLGLIADLVEPEERELSLHFHGLMGVAYVPWRNLGFNLEASMNFNEMRVSGGSSLLFAFNLNFGVITIF